MPRPRDVLDRVRSLFGRDGRPDELEARLDELARRHHAAVTERDRLRADLDDMAERWARLNHRYGMLDGHGLDAIATVDPARWAPFCRLFPPGHFASPVPDLDDVARFGDQLFGAPPRGLPGLELDPEAIVDRYRRNVAPVVADWPFEDDDASRYRPRNGAFEGSDALVLAGELRSEPPARYVEIGSGWSSALALDVADRWLDERPRFTFVEPHPQQLERLLSEADRDEVELIASPVQEVPTERFAELESGDVVFVDNSHVAKIGSDVVDVMRRIMPALGPGVRVHLHDIFWPFEYPERWIEEGRAWNEIYLVDAFLRFNTAFDIIGFNAWIDVNEPAVLDEIGPPELTLPAGGSLWLRRRG